MTSLASIARRSRRGHAVLFAVTVCLLVSTAAVEPLLTRSFSWALVRYHAALQGAVSGQVTLTGDASTPVGKLEAAVDPRVRAVTTSPSGADYTNVNGRWAPPGCSTRHANVRTSPWCPVAVPRVATK